MRGKLRLKPLVAPLIKHSFHYHPIEAQGLHDVQVHPGHYGARRMLRVQVSSRGNVLPDLHYSIAIGQQPTFLTVAVP